MEEEKVVSKGFASDMGDVPGSLVVLAIASFFLCFALYWIVRILHYLFLSSDRRTDENGEPTSLHQNYTFQERGPGHEPGALDHLWIYIN